MPKLIALRVLFCSITLLAAGCVQTVEPDAQDELLIQARDNVANMPRD